MYSREVAGEVLEFGVSGKLVRNVMVMYDRETESLWSQLLGKAIRGSYTGTELEFISAWQTTWDDWKTRHPGTLALVKGYEGLRDPYVLYYSSSDAGVLGETFEDSRLERKEFVIGVEGRQDGAAYPFRFLHDSPVVNDVLDDVPLLVVFDAEHANGVVFSREIEGRVLIFEEHDGLQLVDVETGSLWDGLNGVALSGPFQGARLERVKSTLSFWFGWKDFHPETRVWGLEVE